MAMMLGRRRVFGLLSVGGLGALVASITRLAGAADIRNARAWHRSANSVFDQARFNDAVASYNSAIAEDPQFADAYHNLALASEMVDRKQAIDAWKRFIDVATGREELKFDVARVQARM